MKKGITITSLIVYITCFFLLLTVGTSISSNITYGLVDKKQDVIENEEYFKIYSNLLDSAKDSYDFDIIDNKLIFSNNDEYYVNEKILYKNNSILSKDIENFIYLDMNMEIGSYIDTSICFGIEISFTNNTEKIYVTVGDNIE